MTTTLCVTMIKEETDINLEHFPMDIVECVCLSLTLALANSLRICSVNMTCIFIFSIPYYKSRQRKAHDNISRTPIMLMVEPRMVDKIKIEHIARSYINTFFYVCS